MKQQSIDSVSLDPRFCAVCGEPNDCVLADPSHRGEDPCWCVAETFPKDLLDSVTRRRGSDRCICRSCLDRHVVARIDRTMRDGPGGPPEDESGEADGGSST